MSVFVRPSAAHCVQFPVVFVINTILITNFLVPNRSISIRFTSFILTSSEPEFSLLFSFGCQYKVRDS